MYYRTFRWGNSKNKIKYSDKWEDLLWVGVLLLAALILFSINLGGLPLRDWDEGIVAQVAREIYTAPANSLRWLYPTVAGEPYLNKPPLIHILIAIAYAIGGVNEWTTRLPGAILTALSVPLLYKIGREIFPARLPAVLSALIYLTLLPVVRHGRLAMLDGAVLCFFIFMMWCVLRSRRELRWALGAGIGFGLICLTKGMMGLLLGAIAIVFLFWNTPRILVSPYLWGGIAIGSAPVVFWYGAQLWHYGQTFINHSIFNQSLQRIWTAVEQHKQPVWYYILEILKYSFPWLLFLPQSLLLAKENKNLSWAKLTLVWFSIYLVVTSIMGTKLPWYILPIYPAIALLIGAYLTEVCNWPVSKPYPRSWVIILRFLGVVAFVASLFFIGLVTEVDWYLHFVFMSLAMTFIVTAILITQRDIQFIGVLLWGTYVAFLLFMSSPHWIWELNEAYPVKPVAMMINSNIPTGQKIYTSFPYPRPSLNFYSSRQVIPASNAELQQHWQEDPQPYFLIDAAKLSELNLNNVEQLNTGKTFRPQTITWILIKRQE